jgi:hypothetical protein
MSIKNRGLAKNALSRKVDCRIPDEKFQELQELISKGQGLTMSELVRNIILNRKIRIVHHDNSLDLVMEKLSQYCAVIQSINIQVNQLLRSFLNKEENTDNKGGLRKMENLLSQVVSNQNLLEEQLGKFNKVWLQK